MWCHPIPTTVRWCKCIQLSEIAIPGAITNTSPLFASITGKSVSWNKEETKLCWGWVRTHDLWINSTAPYKLSYPSGHFRFWLFKHRRNKRKIGQVNSSAVIQIAHRNKGEVSQGKMKSGVSKTSTFKLVTLNNNIQYSYSSIWIEVFNSQLNLTVASKTF